MFLSVKIDQLNGLSGNQQIKNTYFVKHLKYLNLAHAFCCSLVHGESPQNDLASGHLRTIQQNAVKAVMWFVVTSSGLLKQLTCFSKKESVQSPVNKPSIFLWQNPSFRCLETKDMK